MTIAEKARFLQEQFIPLLRSIPHHTPPQWGKMNLQQMVEHLANSVEMSSGRVPPPHLLVSDADLPQMRAFLASEKPFRQNINNPLVPETPAPVQLESIDAAIGELEKELDHFFAVFQANPNLTTLNPFFGMLDFEGNVQLLHKHALHHLRQFGVEEKTT